MPGRSGDRNCLTSGSRSLPAGVWSIGIFSSGTRRSVAYRIPTGRAGGRMGILGWTFLSVPRDILRSTHPRVQTNSIWARRIRRGFESPDTVAFQDSPEGSFVGPCVQCGSARQRRRIRLLGGFKAGSCVWTRASFYGLRGRERGFIWHEVGFVSYLLNEPVQTRRLLVPMSAYGALSLDVGRTENSG